MFFIAKRKMYYLLFLLFALSIVVYGCGGGDGGPAPTPTPTPTTSSVTISGLVGGGGGGAGGGSIAKAQTATENPLANAIVEISAYDKNNALTGSVTTSTLSTGTFNAPIILSANGGYIVINITKGGFAGYSKRIDFEKPADVNIQAILDEVVTAIASRADAVFSASTGKKVIKFGLFKTAKGQKVIKVGRDVDIRKQQGTNPNLEISIPVDVIPADTTTLVANLNSYDPTNSNEASRFPGQYRDSSGNPIVSLGFDFMNVTTDSGQSLGAAIAKARKQGKLKKSEGTDFITITRWIYSDNCKTLLRDADDLASQYGVDTTGFNVPVYAYSSVRGLWDLLGIGTIDKNNDGIIDSTNDVITTDLDESGVIGDAGDYQKQCTDKGWEAIVIKINSDDFLNNWTWCNLDYVVFEKPVEICIEKTFIDSAGKPIEGLWVNLYDDTDYVNDSTWSFSSAWGSTDANGKVTLSAVLTNSTTDEDLSGKISYYNPFDYSYQEELVTLGKSPNCTQKTNTITKPKMCQVEGSVKDEGGNGVANQYVYAYGVSTYDYRYAYTDNNGYFLMDVRCETDYDLYTGWNWEVSRVFNVNGVTTDYPGSENKDEADKVTLKDIILQNQAPYAYGWLSSTSIFAGDTITAYIYGWDNECDTPMSWSINGAPSNIAGTANDCSFYMEESITFSSAETYPLSLSVTDSKGKTGTASLGTVYVSATGNRPPVIQNAYPSKYSAGKIEDITLYGSAYDLDGDNLSWKWYANNSEITSCAGSGSSSISTTCSYRTPDADGTVTIKFEVSDDAPATVSQDFNISVGSTGGVDIIIQKKRK